MPDNQKTMPEPKTPRWLDKRYLRAGKNWAPEELEYLGSKYGLVSDKAICRHLQRSPKVVLGHLFRVKEPGLAMQELPWLCLHLRQGY